MRKAGTILPIFSLPSPYGIGTLGKAALAFVDFLDRSGQTYWQILPLVPSGSGDSPYASYSTFAGNPYFIDLDLLQQDGLLEKEEYERIPWGKNKKKVDYRALEEYRIPILRKAFVRGFSRDLEQVSAFRQEHASWVEDYALYMALKTRFNGCPWMDWESGIRDRKPEAVEKYREELQGEVDFWIYIQYLFFNQWMAVKRYANERGIQIIGDIPIYVYLDSVDVWANRKYFWLDERNNPVLCAGVPPDAFSEDGQRWGNPLYRWDVLEEEKYDWWIGRIAHACLLHDRIRLDHFRGFEQFYAIPNEEESAKNGEWCEGPGYSFFEELKRRLGDVDIVAEDLGVITEGVRRLLEKTGYPGMKVLQFAFDQGGSNAYLPHNIEKNSVVYTGTHDNDTAAGWFTHTDPHTVAFAKKYLGLSADEGYHWGMIRGAYGSVAETAMTQIQDFLGLDSGSRTNIPSTPTGNWSFRLLEGTLTKSLADKIHQMLDMYGRLRE